MKALSRNSETSVLIGIYGIYLSAQLEAREETAEIQKAFEEIQNKLREKQMAADLASQNIYRVKAQENRVYQDLIEEIKDFQRVLLRSENSDRHNPSYKRYFSEGLVYFTQASHDDLLERMKKVLSLLELEEEGVLKEWQQKLQSAFDAFKAERKRLKEAIFLSKEAFQREVAAREEWHIAYNRVRAELTILYRSNKNRIQNFFLKQEKRKKKDEPVEESKESDDSKRLIVVS